MAAVAVVAPVTALAAVLELVGMSAAVQAMSLDAVLEVLWLAALEDMLVEAGGCAGWAKCNSFLALCLSAVARCMQRNTFGSVLNSVPQGCCRHLILLEELLLQLMQPPLLFYTAMPPIQLLLCAVRSSDSAF